MIPINLFGYHKANKTVGITGFVNHAKILIVDDDPSTTSRLQTHFSANGHEVMVVPNHRPGFTGALAAHPEAIVVNSADGGPDLVMTCRIIRSDPRVAHVPLIVISDSHDVEDRLRCFAAGAQEFVSKPFHPDEVYARLQVHLRYLLHTLLASKDTHWTAPPQSREDQLFDRAKKLLSGTGASIPTSRSMARQLGTNVEKLNAIFQMRTGMSLHGYKLELRLDQSRRLLRTTRLRVQQIATSVGYRNASDYSRAFRARYGISPREFRDGRPLSTDEKN